MCLLTRFEVSWFEVSSSSGFEVASSESSAPGSWKTEFGIAPRGVEKTRLFSTKKAGVANSRGWEALARRVTGPGRWAVRRDILEKMKEDMALSGNAKKIAVGDWSFATG